MGQYVVKVVLSALVIVAVSELAKRSTLLAALLASLPLTSILAFIWLYLETGDQARLAELSLGILWMVLPSLLFFAAFPYLLRVGLGFWASLTGSMILTGGAYALFIVFRVRV